MVDPGFEKQRADYRAEGKDASRTRSRAFGGEFRAKPTSKLESGSRNPRR